MNNKRSLIALIIALQFWGTSFPVMKYTLHTNHPFALLFYRFLFSFLLLTPWFIFKHRRELRILRDNSSLFLLGLFNFFGMALQIYGIKYTTAAKSVIITQMLIVSVSLLAYFMLKESLSGRKIIGIILSIAGAVILSTNLEFQGLTAREGVLGDTLTFIAVIFWAFFIVLTRKFAQKFGGMMLLFPSVTATALLSIFPAAFTGNMKMDDVGLLAALYLAIFCTIIPTMLFNYALKEMEAGITAIIGPMEIFSSTILSFLFLGETLTLIEISGGLLIILSVYIVIATRKKKSHPHRGAGIK